MTMAGMKHWIERIGKIAKAAVLCGTVAWLVLLTNASQQPDPAHPERYAHRRQVRYVSEETGLALHVLLGANFALFLVACGCHFATRDPGDRM